MRLKPGMTAALLHMPTDLRERLGVPAGVVLVDDPADAEFVLDVVTTEAEAEAALTALAPHISSTMLAWLAYPKSSKAAGHDLSRDTVWRSARTVSLTLVANVSVDETWSALRIRPAEGVRGGGDVSSPACPSHLSGSASRTATGPPGCAPAAATARTAHPASPDGSTQAAFAV